MSMVAICPYLAVFFFTCCVSIIWFVKLILCLFCYKIFYTFYHVCFVVKWLVKDKFFQSNVKPKAKMCTMSYAWIFSKIIYISPAQHLSHRPNQHFHSLTLNISLTSQTMENTINGTTYLRLHSSSTSGPR